MRAELLNPKSKNNPRNEQRIALALCATPTWFVRRITLATSAELFHYEDHLPCGTPHAP
jgi:hypothetical protein